MQEASFEIKVTMLKAIRGCRRTLKPLQLEGSSPNCLVYVVLDTRADARRIT
jgi:hypothetical protein